MGKSMLGEFLYLEVSIYFGMDVSFIMDFLKHFLIIIDILNSNQ